MKAKPSVRLIGLLVSANNAVAAVLTDDFAAGLNPQTWSVDSNQPLYAVVPTNGEIRISKPWNARSDFQYVHLRLNYEARGDFDVRVDFRDASINRVEGMPGNQIQLNTTFGGQDFIVVRSDELFKGSDYDNHHVWANPPGDWFGHQPNTLTNGTLRITRSGTVLRAWFNTTNFFTRSYNSSAVTSISFCLQNNHTRDATAVTFDNFFLSADEIVPLWPSITSALVATGRVNRPFSYTITATGNPTGYGASGLPTGLNVNTASGLISGTPEAAGAFNVLLSATNSFGVGTTNLLLTIAGNAPVQFAGNGHWYQAVYAGAYGISWPDASIAATNAGGHLATITSADENAFAYALVNDPSFWFMDPFGNGVGPWLGGLQPPGSPEPSGNWQWVTGELMTYTNWAAGQPDNYLGNEDRINFFGPGIPQSPQWNDTAASALLRGYIIEYPQFPWRPTLSVTLSNGVVIVSWPLPATGWVLQATNALPSVAAPWPVIPPPYQTNAGNLQFIEPAPTGNKFYRLHRP